MNTYKVDLHTHSKLSPDGSIEEKDYQKVLAIGTLDFIAITDHNTIDFALYCQRKLGKQIIVGEEISTMQGHLISLFLTKPIAAGMDIVTSAEAIKEQEGLVYIPHAYDFFRSGIGEKQLLRILPLIDIIEVFNGRVVFPSFNLQTHNFAHKNQIIGAFGSDSHIAKDLGRGYMALAQAPSNNVNSYEGAKIHGSYNSFLGYLAPKYNRIQKLLNL